MSQASDYLEKKLMDHLFGKAAYTAPTIYVALFTATPNDAGGGTEANYGGYARKTTAPADWNAAGATDGTITNANELAFPAATSGSNTVTHFALYDAATAGNLLIYGAVGASLAVSTGITPKFAAGALSATMA